MHPRRRDYHGCAAADVDLNGHLDLYCTAGGKHGGNGANRKELWLQDASGLFTEHAQEWGVRDEFGRGRQATFVYANGDEFPDLYVTNQQPRKDGLPGPNRLFLNVDGEGFRDAPEFGVNRRIGGGAVQAVDFDLRRAGGPVPVQPEGDPDLPQRGRRSGIGPSPGTRGRTGSASTPRSRW